MEPAQQVQGNDKTKQAAPAQAQAHAESSGAKQAALANDSGSQVHPEHDGAEQAALANPKTPQIHAEEQAAANPQKPDGTKQAAVANPKGPQIHVEEQAAANPQKPDGTKQAARANPEGPQIHTEEQAAANPKKPDGTKQEAVAEAVANPKGPQIPIASSAAPSQEALKPRPKMLPSSKAAPKPTEQDDEYDPGEETVQPPEQVSKATLMKRLARLCAPREDGTYKIPMDVIDSYKNLSSRDQVYRSFEKCGCVLFSKRINRKYEEINEKTVETEYEFLTEQEMIDKGWSEKKIKGAKKSCEKRPGWKRKSEYCDEWMFWVAVKVKGTNKKTKRHTVAEILEGGDDEPMEDPEVAMDDYPFLLEGDGDKTGDGESGGDDDSSDDGEEAGRILRKVNFPDVGKKPQDSCMSVVSCLQKRTQKLQPVMDKLDQIKNMTTSQTKNLAQLVYPVYKESVKTVTDKLTELEDTLTSIYSNGIALGSSDEDTFGRVAQYAEMLGEGVGASAKDAKRCIRQMQHPDEPEHKRREAPNEERDCHRYFKHWGLSLPVPITEKTFVLDDREKAETAYIRVQDWLLYLLKRNRSLLAGGNESLEFQLEAYWMAYRQTHSTHPVFERGLDLGTTIPLAFYSDEGKGPKRGNFVVVAIESPIGLQDVAEDFSCTCEEDVRKAPQQVVPGQQAAGPYTPMEEAALKQGTTCTGHSYLTRHVLFGLPDWVYKHHPEVLEKMTEQDVSHEPSWAATLHQERPWDSTPAMCSVPHDPVAPERVLKYDVFHCFKVGLGRDICGTLVLLARLGYYDDPGASEDRNIKARLNRAYQHFRLWRLASGKTAALRYFSPSLFNLKRLSDYAWANTKGSDTTLLLQYIKFFVTILLQRPRLPRGHAHLFRLLRKTIEESQKAFEMMYSHGVWLRRPCAQNLYLRLMSVLSGYQHLAHHAVGMGMSFFALKPKFHAIHHLAYDLRVALLTDAKLIPNPITWNCEMGEDLIGRVCSLSMKVSTRTINKRVLQRHFLKKANCSKLRDTAAAAQMTVTSEWKKLPCGMDIAHGCNGRQPKP
ncbi:PU1 [Symbiodinium sp. CCMP2456]|nr:PU1 [Symbiodinium sp. CCMP2456]